MKQTLDNPFNPQFGKRPDRFVGRDQTIREFIESLNNTNDPHRTTVVSGIRGSGKTALLSGVSEAIDTKRYVVADVTAGPEFLQAILDQLHRALKKKNKQLTGLTVGALGVNVGASLTSDTEPHGFRYKLTLLVEQLASEGKGVVFLIDELHNDKSDIRTFATSYQHLIREGAEVALIMAGLPHAVNAVLNDQVLTFLHRSHKLFLRNIDILAVEQLYRSTFTQAGFDYEDSVPLLAAKLSQGFCYLIQLIGYYLWFNERELITAPMVREALDRSKPELYQNVHNLILRELSEKDREFLFAMDKVCTQGATDSAIKDILAEMGVDTGYLSRYRQRLIGAGVIEATTRGRVGFLPPYLGEYLNLQQKLESLE